MSDSTPTHHSVRVFNEDVESHGGYLTFSKNDRLSSRLVTERTIRLMSSAADFHGKRVLDMGCGDGLITSKFFDAAEPKEVIGIDPADQAIKIANSRHVGQRKLRFEVGNAHSLHFEDNSFDIVMLTSMLHHDDDPADIIREAFRLAPTIVIHDPNGNNPGLKLLEKVSRYHREHGEKSYTSRKLRKLVTRQGGIVRREEFSGFVPLFSPDWLTRVMHAVEPVIEGVPGLRAIGSAVYLQVATRSDTRSASPTN